MELEQQFTRTRLIRTTGTAKNRSNKSAKPGSQKKSHFVEPYRFDTEKRATLMKTLQECKLGDGEGQRLFVTALEFELGAIRQMSSERTQSAPTAAATAEPQLEAVAQAAHGLQERLGELVPERREQLVRSLTNSDRFKRIYGADYLQELSSELVRLTAACAVDAPVQPISDPQADEETSARFYAMLANAYTECFDQAPSASRSAPFLKVARSVIELTDICVRSDSGFVEACLEG